MKCHNCGFESETNFCPMCGAKSGSQPQPSAPFTQNIPNTQAQNKNQNNSYVQNCQPAQPTIQSNPYVQPSQPVHQNIQNNTYTQNQPNLPITNSMQPATPPAIHPQKTSGKATGGIVAAAILGAVILLGTIIFSYSCVSDIFMQEKENTQFDFERDFINHNTSDIAETSYGSISLKSIEDVFVVNPEDVSKEESYNTNAADFAFQYKITFSIENTSKEAVTVSADDFSVSYDSHNSDTECPKITKSENPLAQSVTINSGEKKDFSIYHYASSEAFQLNAEYRYTDEDKNKKYLIKFSDYIEYQKVEVGVGNLTVHPMELPLCSITLTDAVQTDVKGDSAKIYSFTFNVRNNTAENIEISSNDFAIYAYKDYFDSIKKSNKHICTVSNDETIDIKANHTDVITVSFEIPNDCSTLFVYYKLNNHITNSDKAVGDKNYSIYGMIDPL